MNKRLTVLLAAVLCLLSLLAASLAYALSQSLTTTIIVTVKSVPETNLLPDDQNAGLVEELATSQLMTHPRIKVNTQDILPSGEKLYTILDKL